MSGGGIFIYSNGGGLDMVQQQQQQQQQQHHSCVGCSKAESEIRSLLNKISTNFLDNPSHFLGFDLPPRTVISDSTQLFDQWVQKFERECDPNSPPLCPDLKKRIKDHVCKLLSDSTMASIVTVSATASTGYKRKRSSTETDLSDILLSLKAAALCPYTNQIRMQEEEEEDWRLHVLEARKALFLKIADIPNVEDYPYLDLICLRNLEMGIKYPGKWSYAISNKKKQRTHKFLHASVSDTANLSSEKPQSELSGEKGSFDMLNQPIRRSRRTLLNIGKSEVFRKRIPIGQSFQADITDWTGAPIKKEDSNGNSDLNESRWIGTRIWPLEGDTIQNKEEIIGKGRSNVCACTSPGSVGCIRSHVSSARLHLKSELGPAFTSLGFDEMGEEVSRLWTHEEQLMFDDLVRFNPSSEGKSFWEPALKCFTSKNRQGIISFYFNVFVLRWMSIRTRLACGTVDIDDDENLE